MADEPVDVQKLSPDQLISGFSRSRIGLCLLIAIGLHVVVLALTSMGYIRDTWIDPEGAEQRRVQAEKARQQAPQQRPESPAGPTTQPKQAKDDAGLPERVRNTPIYRATTQAAQPDEIPPDPGELRVPLDN